MLRLPGPDSLGSRALGALLGMVVGDALGAPLGGQECGGAKVEAWVFGLRGLRQHEPWHVPIY